MLACSPATTLERSRRGVDCFCEVCRRGRSRCGGRHAVPRPRRVAGSRAGRQRLHELAALTQRGVVLLPCEAPLPAAHGVLFRHRSPVEGFDRAATSARPFGPGHFGAHKHALRGDQLRVPELPADAANRFAVIRLAVWAAQHALHADVRFKVAIELGDATAYE